MALALPDELLLIEGLILEATPGMEQRGEFQISWVAMDDDGRANTIDAINLAPQAGRQDVTQHNVTIIAGDVVTAEA